MRRVGEGVIAASSLEWLAPGAGARDVDTFQLQAFEFTHVAASAVATSALRRSPRLRSRASALAGQDYLASRSRRPIMGARIRRETEEMRIVSRSRCVGARSELAKTLYNCT